MTQSVNAPKPVLDLLNVEDPEWQGCGYRLAKIPKHETIIYDGKLLVTYEGWDWTESLIICDTINLKLDFEADYLSGPGVKLYVKDDAAKPGYVLLRTGMEYFYIEWS